MNEIKEPLFVGFGHRRRVGKDTLAAMVYTELSNMGVRAYREAFAWKLKDTVHALFAYAGIKDTGTYEREPHLREKTLAEIEMSPRELWIRFGNAMRDITPDVWVRGVMDGYYYRDPCVVLISDVRFPNEFDAIKERGGLTVKVVRPDVPESDDEADCVLAYKPDSEWDYVVRNDEDLTALKDAAYILAGRIKERM